MSKTNTVKDADSAKKPRTLPSDKRNYLLKYVDENFSDSALCLTSVADHMDASIYAISRAFKECTGVGFKDYVTGKRLQYACTLLQTTDHTIFEIAEECGFENSTYFTTVFRREFGTPPSKYRNAARRNAKR